MIHMETKYISLGATCAPTYWLNQLGLRTQAYPFDWTKNTLTQLINVLETDFKDYTESITLSQFSEKHTLEADGNVSGSYIIKNKYGITFAHELVNASETNTFTDKLSRRIARFRELYEECERQITFLLYVPNVIKQSFWKHLEKLISLLPQNSVIYVIIHKDSCTPFASTTANCNVKIIYFDSFEEDWRAPEAFKKVKSELSTGNETSS
jgi:hypothetical protein